jgi:4-alpha-glucanotransferase
MKTDAHWKKIGRGPHHGFAVALFSLRTEKNCGVGEFLDLIPLIEWCRHLGLDCLQLLPLNDTGFDASPYNPLSSCALDPIYLSLWELGINFSEFKQSPRLRRNEVKKKKLEVLRAYFKRSFFPTPEYNRFLSENLWLPEYSHFMALKEQFAFHNWKEWPPNALGDPAEIEFNKFLQYLCFSQMKKVREAADKNRIFLIGDLPHLVSPDSADVWGHGALFHTELSAGAPPDHYNALGQNWGFPPFNWEAMERDGYAWWQKRFSTFANLYHIYRIDHLVGFFRIWTIKEGQKASEGTFLPADHALWMAHGQKILEMMIDNCLALPIAEDLGTIPPEIYPILKQLGICGTKILRQETMPYNTYEPFSLTTVSTADMESLPLWWKTHVEEAKRFCSFKQWHYESKLTKEQEIAILHDTHHTSSFFHINLLQEYLFPFPELSWLDLEESQINVPGTLLPTNWTYRFRPSLEELVKHHPLADTIRKIVR